MSQNWLYPGLPSSTGMSRTQAAQFVQISERTLHNWESGRHDIPYRLYNHRYPH